MRITDFNIDSLRHKVEQEGGFQIAITPVFPNLLNLNSSVNRFQY